jgi:Cu/Ag efflux protein CusF
MKRIFTFCILAGLFSMVSALAIAQEVVHAMAGTVNSVDATAKTVTVTGDEDGTAGTYNELADSKTHVQFDKTLRADATTAGEFKKSGARAVVYYYGYGSMRIVVALRDLGTGPFTKSGGTVIKFDGRDHTISIKNDSGAVESFKIESNTVADTRQGAVSGSKYQPAKGTKVQLIATQVNGSPTAMFIESN